MFDLTAVLSSKIQRSQKIQRTLMICLLSVVSTLLKAMKAQGTEKQNYIYAVQSIINT